jgi:hypothetical protein
MPIGYQMQTGMQPTGSPTTPYRCRPMTDPTPNRPPLWEVMREAVKNAPLAEYENLAAAELRAIADELPKQLARWGHEEMAVQAFLRSEADRAEAGEQ